MDDQLNTDEVPAEEPERASMPAHLKTKWLEALRSGKYAQTHEALASYDDESGSDDPIGYCCLGVLVEVVDGPGGCAKHYQQYGGDEVPSPEWIKKHGISHTDPPLPSLNQNNSFGVVRTSCTDANDCQNKTFAEIADAIETDVIGV